MAIKLCPRCNLNYVKPGMKYCKVCLNELKNAENEEEKEVCPVCGVNLIDSNQDMCDLCLNNRIEMSEFSYSDDEEPSNVSTDGDDMDGMRLIDLDEGDDIPDDVKDEFE